MHLNLGAYRLVLPSVLLFSSVHAQGSSPVEITTTRCVPAVAGPAAWLLLRDDCMRLLGVLGVATGGSLDRTALVGRACR